MITTTRKITILQNRQEAINPLCSTPFIVSGIAGVTVVPGLVWPTLEAAVGSGRWACMTRTVGLLSLPNLDASQAVIEQTSVPHCQDFTGQALVPFDPSTVAGIFVIDGSWANRMQFVRFNSWINSVRLLLVRPSTPGGSVDKRRLSTLGSIAIMLAVLDGHPEYVEQLLAPYRAFLQQHGVTTDPLLYQEAQ